MLREALRGQMRGPVRMARAEPAVPVEESAAAVEGIAGALVSYTSDLKEGVASFREKRTPSYTNT